MELERMMDVHIVELKMKAKSKSETINQMARMLYDDGRINSLDTFVASVYEREDMETTNMDMGVAIPHSNSSAIKKTSVAIARLTKEISWEDYGEPVKIIFLIAVSPDDKGVKHLEVISKIAELLIDEKFIKMLKKTGNAKKLLKEMNKLIGG